MNSILVVDDHPLLREGIGRTLKKVHGISRCDEAENGKIAIEAMEKLPYDLVLMDLQMPVMNGYDATDIVIKRFPKTKVIVLSMVDTEREIIHMLDKGIQGYILKSADGKEIVKAVQHVLDGNIYLSEDVNKVWSRYLREKQSQNKAIEVDVTPREKEIIQMICKQMTCSEMAAKLSISESTVKNHRAHIMEKLSTDNSVGIALYAVKAGLFVL